MNNRGYITNFFEMKSEFIDGRNIKDGYERGWGLRYGDLTTHISNDCDWKECHDLVTGRSIVTTERLMNIFLIIKFYLPNIVKNEKFTIIEFGSYRGGVPYLWQCLQSVWV